MVKIDKKDKKILYQLDINSRQSLSQIGRKVGLPKNVVAYRINKLKEEGIIKTFYTIIDSFKLGYIAFRFYFTYQYVNEEVERQLIEHFTKYKLIWWVISAEGRFDIAVIIWVKDLNEFYAFWEQTLVKFRDFFQSIIFSVYVQRFGYRHSYLLDDYMEVDRTKFEITGGGAQVKIDALDFQILRIIAPNARMPLTDIAKMLNTTATIINYKIKKLTKIGVIQGYRTDIDIEKLGYMFFKADMFLKDYRLRGRIIDFIKSNPHLVRIDASAGVSDLELEFHVRNLAHFHEIMKELCSLFPEAIRDYRYVYARKVHVMNYMPEI